MHKSQTDAIEHVFNIMVEVIVSLFSYGFNLLAVIFATKFMVEHSVAAFEGPLLGVIMISVAICCCLLLIMGAIDAILVCIPNAWKVIHSHSRFLFDHYAGPTRPSIQITEFSELLSAGSKWFRISVMETVTVLRRITVILFRERMINRKLPLVTQGISVIIVQITLIFFILLAALFFTAVAFLSKRKVQILADQTDPVSKSLFLKVFLRQIQMIFARCLKFVALHLCIKVDQSNDLFNLYERFSATY